ncbi:TPA: hypothetical protein DEP96_01270 [Candidatus Uhrbacteria bacterium]|nr:hypothetical protein [Candidatus Uhrbacteria bacterium]
MKKLLSVGGFLAVGLVMLGFGCAPISQVATIDDVANSDESVNKPAEVVTGSWYLTFNLPKDWVMVPQYDEGVQKDVTSVPVTSDMSDVVVQSTNKIVALTGASTLEKDTFVTDDYSYIRVFRLDKHAVIPAEATDVGNNFFKLEKGVNLTYYLKGKGSNYKFVVYWDEADLKEVEKVVVSAKEVTALAQ